MKGSEIIPWEYTRPQAGSYATSSEVGIRAEVGNPQVATEGMRAVFDRRKDHAVVGLDYMVEFSSNLTEWPPSSAIPEVIADERVLEKVGLPFPIQLHQPTISAE